MKLKLDFKESRSSLHVDSSGKHFICINIYKYLNTKYLPYRVKISLQNIDTCTCR